MTTQETASDFLLYNLNLQDDPALFRNELSQLLSSLSSPLDKTSLLNAISTRLDLEETNHNLNCSLQNCQEKTYLNNCMNFINLELKKLSSVTLQ